MADISPRCFSQQDEPTEVERWVPSTCGICSVGCGLDIGVAGGRIVGVRGRADHPVSAGRLGPKGLNQYYANRHPSRATQPLIRNRSGQLVRASWQEAMQLVVERVNEALATDGPDAVAIYNSGQLLLEEYYTLGKIARAGLGIANIDANTRLCTATTAAALMESFGADGPPGAYEDFEHAEVIVLVGHNAAEQSTVLWMRILAAKAGPQHPKVIVIDPRRTLTVSTGADLHLQLKPGTNVALLNGLCQLLIENGTIDRDFIANRTVKFDRFRATVDRYTPDRVEAICGVPATKLGRQANVQQLATLVRMQGGAPDERGGVRKVATTMQAGLASRVSTTITLKTMRLAEIELVTLYAGAVREAEGPTRSALRTSLGRALVHAHVLTAHIASHTGSEADARFLPAPLGEYFAGAHPRACMRCHLDRPGTAGALERTDPHPYTYVCAACHDEVLPEFPLDLAVQMDRWPREVREARVLQHAIGRVSRLNAIGRVLLPLAGLEPELPIPATERAVIVPAMTATPGPAPDERRGTLNIETGEGAEGEYVDQLFSATRVWIHW